MKLADAQALAELYLEHHLPAWSFKFNRRKKALGVAKLQLKRIELSEFWAVHLKEAEILDTLLHEIAHAMAWDLEQYSGHGTPWKRYCRQLGARPSRVADVKSVTPILEKAATWKILCACGKTYYYYRKPRINLARAECRVCHTLGQFELKKNK